MKRYLILLMVLAGCSGVSNIPYVPSSPNKGMAQIVIYHPSGEFTGLVPISSGPNVKINGKVVCQLPNSSFFVASVNPDKYIISSTKMFSIGTSSLDIKTQPNKRYFVRITWNGTKVWSTVGFGLMGEGVAETLSPPSGPFIIESVDEKSATSELKSLNMVNCSI